MLDRRPRRRQLAALDAALAHAGHDLVTIAAGLILGSRPTEIADVDEDGVKRLVIVTSDGSQILVHRAAPGVLEGEVITGQLTGRRAELPAWTPDTRPHVLAPAWAD